MPSSRTQPVRVGGQALPDGVLMRTDRAWAIAHADGRLSTGTLPPTRWKRVPVIRVLAGLIPAMALGLGLIPGQGRRQRSVPWAMVRALVLAEVAVVALDLAASRAGLPATAGPIVVIVMWLAAFAMFRVFAPAAQWRYHGAEHKAVTAYEQGVHLHDVEAVLRCPRVHNRCGTNIVFWLALAGPFVAGAPFALQLLVFPLLLGILAEVLSVAGRHATSPLGWVVLAPGRLLQKAVTTREPFPDEQAVGCRAIVACLSAHEAAVASDAAGECDDQQYNEDKDDSSDSDVHGLSLPSPTRV